MKKQTILTVVAVLAVLALICGIFYFSERKDTDKQAAGEIPDTLLVTVNGQEIRNNSHDLVIWVNYVMAQIESTPNDATVQLANQYAMENAIRYTVLKQNLAKMGYPFTEEDMEAARAQAGQEWEDAVETAITSIYGVAADAPEEERAAVRESAEAYLESNSGYTRESYTEEAELKLVYGKAEELAEADITVTDEEVEAYLAEEAAEDEKEFRSMAQQNLESGGATPTEEEISAAAVQMYESYKNYYSYDSRYVPEGYRGITHILLAVDEGLMQAWTDLKTRLDEGAEGVTQEAVDEAKQAILDSVQDKVDEIRAKLEAGASFEDLIPEYGTDPGMEDETARTSGYPVHEYSMVYVSDFTKAAMALENVGDVSEPVVTKYGVHIMHYLRDIPGGPVELTDELKETLRKEIAQNRASDAYSGMLDQWVSESEIVWTEAGEAWNLSRSAAAE